MVLIPIYPHDPIKHVESLARAIGYEVGEIEQAAQRVDLLYSSFDKKKPDGTFRTISAPQEPLIGIQRAIYRKILKHVIYPDYLHGAIKEHSPLTNAREHIARHVLISLDITKFYDNARSELVFDVWRRFHHFAEPVATLLTILTTRNGVLPQGAPTSQAIANLLFWEREWLVVKALNSEGLRYTRYIDDTYVSSSSPMSQGQLQWAIGRVRHLFRSYGLQAKNKKTSVAFRGDRQVVNHLCVNRRVSMVRKDRCSVAAAVHNAILFKATGRLDEVDARDYKLDSPERIEGRLVHLGQFHPRDAERLRAKLIASGAVVRRD